MNDDPFTGPVSAREIEIRERQQEDIEFLERTRRQTKRKLDDEDAEKKYAEPLENLRVRSRRLDEFLLEPDKEEKYIIDQLLPFDGNATIPAPKKTGKTTFSGNLARSMADGTPFLGTCAIAQTSVVGLWDYEMSERQLREWLRDVGIENTHNVHIMALRGLSMSFKVGEFAIWAENWLIERGIDAWIIDPGHRAATGFMKTTGDPNEAIMEFTETLDRIKGNAGLRNLFVPLHTGLQGEHARGGARWGDWPDAIWSIRKDDDGTRFISAEGRDVEMDEKPLIYDRRTRLLSLDPFNRPGHRAMEPRVADHTQTIINWLKSHPKTHPSKARLRTELRDLGVQIGNQEVLAAVERGVDNHALAIQSGKRGAQRVWLMSDWENASAAEREQTAGNDPRNEPPE